MQGAAEFNFRVADDSEIGSVAGRMGVFRD